MMNGWFIHLPSYIPFCIQMLSLLLFFFIFFCLHLNFVFMIFYYRSALQDDDCMLNFSCYRPEMVVGWYHSHPGFGCWLSGVDINTQQVITLYPYIVVLIILLIYSTSKPGWHHSYSLFISLLFYKSYSLYWEHACGQATIFLAANDQWVT